MIKIEIDGLEELLKELETRSAETRERVSEAVEASMYRIQRRMRHKIRQRGSGRIYEKYQPRRTHQASSPGEPPATDEGALAASIYTEPYGLHAYVGVRQKYAHYLEFGTKNMDARPFVVPSLEEDAEQFVKDIKEAMK